jgi:hypothetical protein
MQEAMMTTSDSMLWKIEMLVRALCGHIQLEGIENFILSPHNEIGGSIYIYVSIATTD